MANDQVRIQVRENSDDHDWQDVGHKSGDQAVPVSLTSLPLPTGAATSANQTNGSQITKIKETIPTDTTKTNPSIVLDYDGVGNLTTITKTVEGVDYVRTLTYDGLGNLTDISSWV